MKKAHRENSCVYTGKKQQNNNETKNDDIKKENARSSHLFNITTDYLVLFLFPFFDSLSKCSGSDFLDPCFLERLRGVLIFQLWQSTKTLLLTSVVSKTQSILPITTITIT